MREGLLNPFPPGISHNRLQLFYLAMGGVMVSQKETCTCIFAPLDERGERSFVRNNFSRGDPSPYLAADTLANTFYKRRNSENKYLE